MTRKIGEAGDHDGDVFGSLNVFCVSLFTSTKPGVEMKEGSGLKEVLACVAGIPNALAIVTYHEYYEQVSVCAPVYCMRAASLSSARLNDTSFYAWSFCNPPILLSCLCYCTTP